MYETEAEAQAALDEVGAVLGFAITLDPKLPRGSTSAALGWSQGWSTSYALVTIAAWPEGFSVRISPMDGGDRWSGVKPTIADAARALVDA